MTDDLQPESEPVISGSIPPLAPTRTSSERDDPEALPLVPGKDTDPPVGENQHSFDDDEFDVDSGANYHGADPSI